MAFSDCIALITQYRRNGTTMSLPLAQINTVNVDHF